MCTISPIVCVDTLLVNTQSRPTIRLANGRMVEVSQNLRKSESVDVVQVILEERTRFVMYHRGKPSKARGAKPFWKVVFNPSKQIFANLFHHPHASHNLSWSYSSKSCFRETFFRPASTQRLAETHRSKICLPRKVNGMK